LNRNPTLSGSWPTTLGYGDLGSYGQEVIRTPRLDQMAEEGLRFTQFYSGHTVCAPARSSLMTGMHTGHTRIRGNHSALTSDRVPLEPEDLTVAEVLQNAGYKTGLIGKWGLGEPGTQVFPI
jgi:arylsulfatase A-like enzyme